MLKQPKQHIKNFTPNIMPEKNPFSKPSGQNLLFKAVSWNNRRLSGIQPAWTQLYEIFLYIFFLCVQEAILTEPSLIFHDNGCIICHILNVKKKTYMMIAKGKKGEEDKWILDQKNIGMGWNEKLIFYCKDLFLLSHSNNSFGRVPPEA